MTKHKINYFILISITLLSVSYIVYLSLNRKDNSCNKCKQEIKKLQEQITELEKSGNISPNMDETSKEVKKSINDFIVNVKKDENYPNDSFKTEFKSFINNFDSVQFNVTFKRKGTIDISDIYTGDSIFIILRENPNLKFEIISFDAVNTIDKAIDSKNINIVIQ